MKRILSTGDTLTNNISLGHLLLFVASLPFDRFYSELILISLAAHLLIHLRSRRFLNFPVKQVLLLQSVYWVTVVATLYTAWHRQAFSLWGLQLAIFLMPLLLAASGLNLSRYRSILLQTFSAVCTLSVGYLEVDALRTIRYGHLPYNALFSEAFINHNFSAPLGIHPTYLSMYAALSAVHLLCCLLSMRPVAGKLACLAGMAVLAMGIVQLGSKAVLAAFLLLLCLSPFFPARVQGGKKIWILVMGVALFTAVLLGSSTSLQRRFVDGFVNDITNTNTGHTKEEYRIVRWKAALALAGRSPLWGYGTGSEMPLLRKEYFRRRLYNSYINELNTHNQYLAFLLTAGAAGLLVFLATLFLGFRQAVRNRDMMLFAFVLIVSMVSLSENILGVNKGIFFYAFFFPLLLFSSGRPGLYSPAGRQPYGRRIRFIQEGNTPDDSARHEPALH